MATPGWASKPQENKSKAIELNLELKLKRYCLHLDAHRVFVSRGRSTIEDKKCGIKLPFIF
jgi:hypothetical protein